MANGGMPDISGVIGSLMENPEAVAGILSVLKSSGLSLPGFKSGERHDGREAEAYEDKTSDLQEDQQECKDCFTNKEIFEKEEGMRYEENFSPKEESYSNGFSSFYGINGYESGERHHTKRKGKHESEENDFCPICGERHDHDAQRKEPCPMENDRCSRPECRQHIGTDPCSMPDGKCPCYGGKCRFSDRGSSSSMYGLGHYLPPENHMNYFGCGCDDQKAHTENSCPLPHKRQNARTDDAPCRHQKEGCDDDSSCRGKESCRHASESSNCLPPSDCKPHRPGKKERENQYDILYYELRFTV